MLEKSRVNFTLGKHFRGALDCKKQKKHNCFLMSSQEVRVWLPSNKCQFSFVALPLHSLCVGVAYFAT